MVISAKDIRDDQEKFLEFKRHHSPAQIEFCPIRSWAGHTVIQIGDIELKEGLQWVEVLNITDLKGGIARFSGSWPEYDIWLPENQRHRPFALVVFPDEGHISILLESGCVLWRELAEIPLRVVPGSKVDFDNARKQMLDELDQGGSFSL